MQRPCAHPSSGVSAGAGRAGARRARPRGRRRARQRARRGARLRRAARRRGGRAGRAADQPAAGRGATRAAERRRRAPCAARRCGGCTGGSPVARRTGRRRACGSDHVFAARRGSTGGLRAYVRGRPPSAAARLRGAWRARGAGRPGGRAGGQPGHACSHAERRCARSPLAPGARMARELQEARALASSGVGDVRAGAQCLLVLYKRYIEAVQPCACCLLVCTSMCSDRCACISGSSVMCMKAVVCALLVPHILLRSLWHVRALAHGLRWGVLRPVTQRAQDATGRCFGCRVRPRHLGAAGPMTSATFEGV